MSIRHCEMGMDGWSEVCAGLPWAFRGPRLVLPIAYGSLPILSEYPLELISVIVKLNSTQQMVADPCVGRPLACSISSFNTALEGQAQAKQESEQSCLVSRTPPWCARSLSPIRMCPSPLGVGQHHS